jgi:hypothetical protein
MKTFSSLKFQPHAIARKGSKDPRDAGAEIAQIDLENGIRISVIRGSNRFLCGPSTYEVMIARDGERPEVVGYQRSADITEIMKRLQST